MSPALSEQTTFDFKAIVAGTAYRYLPSQNLDIPGKQSIASHGEIMHKKTPPAKTQLSLIWLILPILLLNPGCGKKGIGIHAFKDFARGVL